METPLARTLWDSIGNSDITHLVLSYLSAADLSALSLVNKASNLLVSPYLYSNFEFKWFRQPNITYASIIPFIRTLLDRPDLAMHVRRVSLKSGTSSSSGDKPWSIETHTLDLQRATHAIDLARPEVQEYAAEWKDGLQRGWIDAVVTFLVSRLPNLKCLEMSQSFTKETPLLGRFLRMTLVSNAGTAGHTHSLFQLQRVSYTHWFPDQFRRQYGRNTENILPFFYARGIRELCLALDNPETFTWPFETKPDLSNITSLHLTFIREQHLQHILSLTKNLRTFHWLWYYSEKDRHKTNLPTIDLELLSTALENVSPTLKNLQIFGSAVQSQYWNEYSPWVDIKGSLRSLHLFPSLRTVNAPLPFLLGAWGPNSTILDLEDVIPTTVRDVTINDDLYPHQLREESGPEGPESQNEWRFPKITSAIGSWATTWTSSYCLLKSVTLTFKDHYVFKEEYREEIFELGRCQGVKIKIISYYRPIDEGKIHLKYES